MYFFASIRLVIFVIKCLVPIFPCKFHFSTAFEDRENLN